MAFLVVLLAALAPLSTKVPLGQVSEYMTYHMTPMILFTCISMLLVSSWVYQHDKLMGLLAGWFSLMILWSPSLYQMRNVSTLVFSLVLVVVSRSISNKQMELAIKVLCVVGALEVSLMTVQTLGFDLLWSGLVPTNLRPGGTFGNRSYAAAFLSMLLSVAPTVAIPILIYGIIISKSILGISIGVFVLLYRFSQQTKWILLVGAALIGWAIQRHGSFEFSLISRLVLWREALLSGMWWQWIIGHGPGSWFMEVPLLQDKLNLYLFEGYYIQAHNEFVQILFEGGLVSLTIVCFWLFWQAFEITQKERKIAFLAVLLNCFTMFPLQLVTTGSLSALLIGYATKKEDSNV